MRRDGIPYVQNPKVFYPPIDINKLTLDELKKKYLKSCGKSQGDLSVCSKCPSPCQEGKRAMQLLANEIYNDPPVPLYGGKTLIERAKEENLANRAKAEAEKIKEEAKKIEKKVALRADKRRYLKDEEWWDDSVKSGDQVKFLVEKYGLSKTQAKKKIYYHNVKYAKPEEPPKGPVVKTEPVKKETVKPEPPTEERSAHNSNDLVTRTFELKIDDLMKKQAEYKSKMDEYKKLYDEVSDQIDVLCKAMDVFDKA